MKSNPILEDVWRIKDELAREANYDLHQLCESTRRWMAEHPHGGPVVHNAEELRQLIAEKDASVLNTQPWRSTTNHPSPESRNHQLRMDLLHLLQAANLPESLAIPFLD
jgi:hypothetical protein